MISMKKKTRQVNFYPPNFQKTKFFYLIKITERFLIYVYVIIFLNDF